MNTKTSFMEIVRGGVVMAAEEFGDEVPTACGLCGKKLEGGFILGHVGGSPARVVLCFECQVKNGGSPLRGECSQIYLFNYEDDPVSVYPEEVDSTGGKEWQR